MFIMIIAIFYIWSTIISRWKERIIEGIDLSW